jgi:hypothetical protein
LTRKSWNPPAALHWNTSGLYQRLSAVVAWGSAGVGVGAGAGRRVHWRPNSRITGIVQTSGTTSQIGRSAHQARLG